MVVASTVGARAHGNHPSRIRHLIVDLAEGWRHFVRQSSRNNHDIGLSWRGTENDAEAILVVSGGRQVHHLDGAAGETESERPEGALTCPIGHGIERGAVISPCQLVCTSTRIPERNATQEEPHDCCPYSAYCTALLFPS